MSSETSIKPGQVFVLLSMAAATLAVSLTPQTHPAALIFMSAGVLACGAAAYFFHTALFSLAGAKRDALPPAAMTAARRDTLAADKHRVLHAIKELEFDHRMGKINEADFGALSAPLRRRAVQLMADLDQIERADDPPAVQEPSAGVGQPITEVRGGGCAACGTTNDADAKFCKSCGAKL